jgi:DNA processing protein
LVTTWMHLGARLSGRALRFLVDSGLGPEGAARLGGGALARHGFSEKERAALREALAVVERSRAAAGKASGRVAGCGASPGVERAGRVVTAADADYPAGFFRLDLAPAVVWMRGSPGGAETRRVALVGARRATRGGREFARELAALLAARGVEVWSGLARGVDGEAHAGALSGGRTVAVLGCGLDVTYPPEHGALLERVCAGGAALTEFAPGTQPLPAYFPQRNRLLAAAAEAVLVVEAGERSGALTTVNWALQLGTPVLVAPGDPRAESCRGSNQLLRAGATPLLDVSDVQAALGWARAIRPSVAEVARGASGRASGPDERAAVGAAPDHPLLAALGGQALHVDELAGHWPGPGQVAAELVRLELAGRIRPLGQGYYELAGPGER